MNYLKEVFDSISYLSKRIRQLETRSVGSIFQTYSTRIVAVATDVDTSSGIWYWRVPSTFNGMRLLRPQAYTDTAGVTNATTIQVRNITKYPANDALSSAISIASGATVGTPGTVDSSYCDVATDDLIKIYVTGQSTTKPKGLFANLEYRTF
jgi:hypothetical protein